MNQNYSVFHDRALSLLERWAEYVKKNPNVDSRVAVKGFLTEINDSYTQMLLAHELADKESS